MASRLNFVSLRDEIVDRSKLDVGALMPLLEAGTLSRSGMAVTLLTSLHGDLTH